MAAGAENICEASLDFGGMFFAVDILHRVEDDVWELYEVKDSPEVKPQFIKDAAYQAWVLDKCGVQLDGVFVVYHYDDEYDPFEPVDVTQEAIDYAQVILSKIQPQQNRSVGAVSLSDGIVSTTGSHSPPPK